MSLFADGTTTYYDYPVLRAIPEPPLSGARTASLPGQTFGPPAGGVERHTLRARAGGTHELTFLATTRAAVLELEAFVHARRGSHGLFWFPTWQYEFGLVASAYVDILQPVVQYMGYTERLLPQLPWRHLALLFSRQGNPPFLAALKVNSASVRSDGHEQLHVFSPDYLHGLHGDRRPVMLGRLCLGRLADDTVETRWHTFAAATITLRLEEVPNALPDS